MAERKRSTDGSRDSDAFVKDEDRGTISEQGRAGGDLARVIGSEDEKKRAEEKPAGATRKRKSDEERPGTSNLGEENR
ncbi:hypothetical protein SAMN05444722_1357 [Rhodovulum sp. ES.010]|uniref:hypothetical protein n=1 Tax=Rhodovulum sp. ES.010 TaxID=1882821 RepID=UPI00092BF8CA|nr:hypothetical protein [Rhodovulum sp. ES.010]SIO31043.1 hypothetical protein SAMN05444722_1357 [Rhodovulum sp. ES.010]